MKLDIHSHCKLTKDVDFAAEYTEVLFDSALEVGLDAVAVTEHFHTYQFEDAYNYILENSQEIGDILHYKNGLYIYPGKEVDTKDGNHILVLGNMKTILEINRALDDFKDADSFINFSSLMDLLDDYNVLRGIGHPFRKCNNIENIEIEDEELFRLDFVDLNAKDIHKKGEAFITNMIMDFANKFNLSILAGSDTHEATQYGSIYSEFDYLYENYDDLYQAILDGNYDIYISEDLDLRVESATKIKKALKRLALKGENYLELVIE